MKQEIILTIALGLLLAGIVSVLMFNYLEDKTVCDFEITSRDFQMCMDVPK